MTTLHCCATIERPDKTLRLMRAMAAGWREGAAEIVMGAPPKNNNPFAVWGHLWLAADICPKAVEERRPFYHFDNGFWDSAKGGRQGYYRISYRGISPVHLRKPDPARTMRHPVEFKPWRKTGGRIVVAMPGNGFGKCVGISTTEWCDEIADRLRRVTDRPIHIRDKGAARPLDHDLRDAWALVTHSSNAATAAVISGIPVFCGELCPAAPVGNSELWDMENPLMPDREHWWQSLLCQQFTLDELDRGVAAPYLKMIQQQVDGK